jgi:mannose-6-phosphate isomerase-like protein (cupin superfamily)
MPEPNEPALDRVREALRDHDRAAEPAAEAAPAPRLEGGVTVAELDPDADERFQRLRRELGVTAFGLNLIRLRPRQQGRIHRHERQEEVYVVLEGTLTLEVEGEPRELPRGALARVAPGVRRRLSNRGGEVLLVLAIGGAERHEGRDGEAFAAWEDETGVPPQELPLPPDLP